MVVMPESQKVRKVLEGGRITIDKAMLKLMRIKPGDYIVINPRQGYLEILPATVTVRRS